MIQRLLATTILFVAAPALAAEHVPTTTFTTGAGVTGETGWAFSGGKWTATAAYDARLYANDVTMLPGRTYHWSLTVEAYTAGDIDVRVGAPKDSVNTLAVPVTNGLLGATPIADNFTYANGIQANDHGGDAASPDVVSSFRFYCITGQLRHDDPMVAPGKPGASHMHEFIGNTGSNANSTYKSLRQSGGTTCGDSSSPAMRASYWAPQMKNGAGSYVLPYIHLLYYKGTPDTNTACNPPIVAGVPDLSSGNYIGKCLNHLPDGLLYVAGFNMHDMTGGALAAAGSQEDFAFRYECRQKASPDQRVGTTTSYRTIDDVVDAGCPWQTSILYQLIQGETCWNGTQLDTPNHRDHMSYPGAPLVEVDGIEPQASCPQSFPYVIPTWSWQRWYVLDANFAAKKWHLSSDEMLPMAYKNGTSSHGDYWNTWSPTASDTWSTHCLRGHLSCELGSLGDGTELKRQGQRSTIKYLSVSTSKYGEGPPITANGTFSGEITAQDGGQLYLYGYFGFSGRITAWSLTDVTKSTNHNVTVTGSR